MKRSSWSGHVSGGALVLLAAAVGAPPSVPVSAQPVGVRAEAPLPPELRYVPVDAALYVYADVRALWSGDLALSLRASNKELFERVADTARGFGVAVEDVKTVSAFVPKIKNPRDTERFGVVATFGKAFDKEKLAAGVKGALPEGAKVQVLAPSETVCVVLVGLGEEYAKSQKDADGPLAGALRAAASGQYALVAGVTPANLSDELQSDELPAQLSPFRPILKAEAITVTANLGKSLDLAVRVRTQREELAVGAEKALALLRELVIEEFDREKSNSEKEVGMKDLAAVFEAALGAAKGAKVGANGAEARLSASLRLDNLPLASAYRGVGTRVTAAPSTKSANNLKQIGLAMHNYHDANDAFPSAAVCDKKGKPLLSWRVAILPYIEQDALYREFKLDEPWDSAHNKTLLTKMPNVYLLPGSQSGNSETHYQVFVGNGAAFDWSKGHKIVDFLDGTSNTLLAVTAARAVPWTKPDELAFDPEKDMRTLITLAGGRAEVLLCDGSVRTLKTLPSKETLHALITRNGEEIIGPDF